MGMQELKKQLRREMEMKRSALSPANRLDKSADICRLALNSVLHQFFAKSANEQSGDQAAPILFTYIPVRAEVDVTPIVEWCWEQGIGVAVPRVVSEERRFTLHLIRSFDDLQVGAYGIREPKAEVPVLASLDRVKLMIVPGLAFDEQMGRLGYGGGYYDRFMEECQDQSGQEPFKLALAYDIQLVPDVPMASHDLRVDAVVTEFRILHKKL